METIPEETFIEEKPLNENIISRVQEWDPSTMVEHATVICTARRRSGKSFATKRILEANKKRFDEIYIFSGTIDMPVNRKEYDFIPTENMYNHLDEEVIRKILNRQIEMLEFNDQRKKKDQIRSNICIILDDILTDSTFRKANNIVSELFVQGRHSHITLLVLVQSFSGREGVPPILRKNSDYIISFFQHNVNDRKSLAEQFLSVVDTKLGMEYLRAITNEAHTAAVIDVNNTSARTYEDYIFKYKAPEKVKPFFIGQKKKKGTTFIKVPKEEKLKKPKLTKSKQLLVNSGVNFTKKKPCKIVNIHGIAVRTLDKINFSSNCDQVYDI